MGHVVCYRSGEAFVARRVPHGTIRIISGHGTRLKRILSACARHAYDGQTLLVPGVPEAETDVEAMEAVKAFEVMLSKRMAKKPLRKPRGLLL